MSSIQIIQGGRAAAASVQPGENLLSALRRAGYSIPAACGGKGRCGKCRVPVNGVMRLACRTMPQDGDTVELPITSGGVVLTSTGALPKAQPGGTGLAAAVDLGTTTAALRLFDRASGELLAEAQGWNRQASYGADVISRIQYTLENPDGLAELSRCIRGQITELLRQALGDAGRSKTEVRELVLVGNTVMQHIFDGRPVGSIARAPFKPEMLFEDTLGAALDGIPVRLAPCVAGYVGGATRRWNGGAPRGAAVSRYRHERRDGARRQRRHPLLRRGLGACVRGRGHKLRHARHHGGGAPCGL